MSGGNGADLGQVLRLLNDLIAMQREMQQDIRRLDARVDDLASQVASLREEVRSYHADMVGHGMLISEHGARPNRVEQHPNLPPLK